MTSHIRTVRICGRCVVLQAFDSEYDGGCVIVNREWANPGANAGTTAITLWVLMLLLLLLSPNALLAFHGAVIRLSLSLGRPRFLCCIS